MEPKRAFILALVGTLFLFPMATAVPEGLEAQAEDPEPVYHQPCMGIVDTDCHHIHGGPLPGTHNCLIYIDGTSHTDDHIIGSSYPCYHR